MQQNTTTTTTTSKPRARIGMFAACKHCGQDLQFQGGRDGWRDRGGNRGCVAFFDRAAGEMKRPTSKHAPQF